MIAIIAKTQCCGCSSCAQRCPKECISMVQDEEGFFYPQVNTTTCIDCGLCEKVCPILAPKQAQKPLKVLAAKNPDETIRKESSSGGIFSMIAESVIREGGVVFGARFDENWQVVLDYNATVEGLATFRGSKYVQARVGDTYKQCEQFLNDGRKVLFSGTPCQVAGLKHFLRKDYDNLLAIEIACHGVPSPQVWQKYLTEVKASFKLDAITSINFRNKKYGWNGYYFSLEGVTKNGKSKSMMMPHGDNPFYRGFLNHLYMRPSCYVCPAKNGMSGADLTLADFWGIDRLDKSLDDNKGYSTIVVHTKVGEQLMQSLLGALSEYPFSEIIKYNPALTQSIRKYELSEKFWQSTDGVIKTVERLCGDSHILKLKKRINSIIHKPKEVK